MFKYAKVVDKETGLCEVGLGTNVEFYFSLGMREMNVDQSEIDGQWYLFDKCPHFTPEEEAAKREKDFKSKFFEIPNFGWFRKVPKGYQSAVECLNLAFNNVNILGSLPAEMMIFYQEPDFTDPEQCTEEWLVEHQIKSPAMTREEFAQFYAGFSVAWNTEEHE